MSVTERGEPAENPFEAPKTEAAVEQRFDDPVAVRRAHLSHETSVRAIGSLYLFGGCLSIAIGLAGLVVNRDVLMAAFIGFGVAIVLIGSKTRRLDRWARVPATILSVLGLLLFPFGTVICGCAIVLLWSRKGAMVFSDPYQLVVQQTPEIRYHSSSRVGIVLSVIAFLGLLNVCSNLVRSL